MDIEQMFFNEIAGDKYAEAKALAYVVFRELVEDVHEKYNIPDATIHELNRRAVDRAEAYIRMFQDKKNGESIYKGFLLNAIYGKEWDDPHPDQMLVEWKKLGDRIV